MDLFQRITSFFRPEEVKSTSIPILSSGIKSPFVHVPMMPELKNAEEMKPYITFQTKNYTISFDSSLLPFEDKDSYLTWRSAWIQAYMYLSDKIRYYKSERRHDNPDQSDFQSKAAWASTTATAMLELRSLSKIKAGQQRDLLKRKAVI